MLCELIQAKNSITYLEFNFEQMEDWPIDEAKFLLTNLLTKHPSLKVLNLSDSYIEDENYILSIGKILAEEGGYVLEKLKLPSKLCNRERNLEKFNLMVPFIHSIKFLDLSNNFLGSLSNIYNFCKKGYCPFHLIKDGLIGNSSIEELDLSSNNFCNNERSLRMLAELIVKNQTLKKINLDLNKIDSQKLIDEIAKISSSNTVISKKLVTLNFNKKMMYNRNLEYEVNESSENPYIEIEEGNKFFSLFYKQENMEKIVNITLFLLREGKFDYKMDIDQIRYLIDCFDSTRRYVDFKEFKKICDVQEDKEVSNLIMWAGIKYWERFVDVIEIFQENGCEFGDLKFESIEKIMGILKRE